MSKIKELKEEIEKMKEDISQIKKELKEVKETAEWADSKADDVELDLEEERRERIDSLNPEEEAEEEDEENMQP